jgi:antitoxin (DNA-binding transcriptional repressor) of toxin-antitoxin stability system
VQVDLQYAEEHLAALISAADEGQDVVIARPGKPSLALANPNS